MNDWPLVFIGFAILCAGILLGLVWGYWWSELDRRDSVRQFEARRRALGPRSLP